MEDINASLDNDIVHIEGPAGPQGIPGPTEKMGDKGETKPSGKYGPIGYNGPTGKTGPL